jgi:hypothetical protein
MRVMGRTARERAKNRGRRRQSQADPWRIEAVRTVDIPTLEDGTPAVRSATLEQVLAAFDRLPDGSWKTMRKLIRPVFHRRRPFPFAMEFVSQIVPPGVSIGFAADVGPSFAHVHQGMLDDWKIDLEALSAVAFANLRRSIIDRDAGNLVREPVDGVPTVVYQSGDGWASTLLLVPDLIEDVLGPGERLFLAPMRDVLIDLPPGVDLGFASWLTSEFEALDPNALCLEAFLYEGGRLTIVPLDRGAAMA